MMFNILMVPLCAEITRLVELKVHRPDDVRYDRAHGTDDDTDTAQAPLLLAIGHLEALFTP